mgnify:CR=1 FL=1
MTITGKDAMDLFESIKQRDNQNEAELLDRKKADAAARGKEPFDLAKLASLADTSDQGSLHTTQEQQARWERVYYVSLPDAMTIEELADYVNELGRWSGG